MQTARVMHYDLTVANLSACQWWTAVSPEDYKDGLIYTDLAHAVCSVPRPARFHSAALSCDHSGPVRIIASGPQLAIS